MCWRCEPTTTSTGASGSSALAVRTVATNSRSSAPRSALVVRIAPATPMFATGALSEEQDSQPESRHGLSGALLQWAADLAYRLEGPRGCRGARRQAGVGGLDARFDGRARSGPAAYHREEIARQLQVAAVVGGTAGYALDCAERRVMADPLQLPGIPVKAHGAAIAAHRGAAAGRHRGVRRTPGCRRRGCRRRTPAGRWNSLRCCAGRSPNRR